VYCTRGGLSCRGCLEEQQGVRSGQAGQVKQPEHTSVVDVHNIHMSRTSTTHDVRCWDFVYTLWSCCDLKFAKFRDYKCFTSITVHFSSNMAYTVSDTYFAVSNMKSTCSSDSSFGAKHAIPTLWWVLSWIYACWQHVPVYMLHKRAMSWC
jgi:hypothetical protein